MPSAFSLTMAPLLSSLLISVDCHLFAFLVGHQTASGSTLRCRLWVQLGIVCPARSISHRQVGSRLVIFAGKPTLYSDIRKYVEQALLYDFNLLIEDFTFYQQLTPKMQTDLIQSTRVFKEFERQFSHFFEECERGFTNEMII